MSWFDDQIRQRKEYDDDIFSDAFIKLANSALGTHFTVSVNNDMIRSREELENILHYYRIKSKEVPEQIRDFQEQMEYLLRPHGIMHRRVVLEEGWYKDAVGPMLATFAESGTVVALIPSGMQTYKFVDEMTGKKRIVNAQTAQLFDSEAVCFYKPLPIRELHAADLFRYIIRCISAADVACMAITAIVVALIGLLIPKLNNIMLSDVITIGSMRSLWAIVTFAAGVMISQLMFTAIQTLLGTRINTKVSVSVSAAVMMRVLSLPAEFFRQFTSGELANRVSSITETCEMIVSSILTSSFTALFSLVYIPQMYSYAPNLGRIAIEIIVVTLVFSIISAYVQMNYYNKLLLADSKENGTTFAMLQGIQKIRLAGAEKRAFAKWADSYAAVAGYNYNPPLFLKLNAGILLAISLLGAVIIYISALRSGISVPDYYAFNTAYAMASAAFMELSSVALLAAQIKPMMEMAEPILKEMPEISENKEVLTKLNGNVELSHVSFRYREDMPYVINDLSLKIHSGQYIAIVGKTGCGKTTLVRLLLGFEKPDKGAIYYNGKDMKGIDLKSLRRKIGTVTQDGGLFQGDIYSNIVISAPELTLDDAWAAARLAGIAEDIEAMPMGMNTVISEGGGGISGGQKQRIMIARAIASKPRILIFDEATSALDNLTQKQVSESLDQLNCTRIVIAHRLSTIRHCDRILVMDAGAIVEDGTYEELIEKDGIFAELVERQRLDKKED